jgi:hypothetical protein
LGIVFVSHYGLRRWNRSGARLRLVVSTTTGSSGSWRSNGRSARALSQGKISLMLVKM